MEPVTEHIALRSSGRCPTCGSATRPDAPFCSLCHHDLRPPPPPAPAAPLPVVGPSVVDQPLPASSPAQDVDPLTAPLFDLVAPLPPVEQSPVEQPAATTSPARSGARWTCRTCRAENAFGEQVCVTCGIAFLTSVHGEASFVVPGVGDLHKMSRGQRVGLAAVAVATFVLVPLALLTFLLTETPPAAPASDLPAVVLTDAPAGQ